MLLMKKSDQNALGDHPKMFIKKTGKRKFADRYELVHAPFHNPTNEPKTWAFKKFLEDKLKQNLKAIPTVVTKLKKDQILLVDPRDLLKFGEHNIHTLSKHHLMVENEMFEVAANAFIGMITTIIDKRLWAGALADSDVHLVEKS
ncbi:unnamed protein product [Lactuca saligna]|uniref:Uncharacterized protein n=1 Tax=Lactuca saligna TaxID=75948 RepID=A0AA36E1W8_LACSI|nr:unnamed protein product [Lactuca saligna]